MRPDSLTPIFADITALPGVGPKIGALISRVAGPRIVDLLLTPPVSVIDRSARPEILDAPLGAIATVLVTVDRHEPPPKGRRGPYRVICSDESGFLTLVFFHARGDYLNRRLPVGSTRLVSGMVDDYRGSRQMTHPDHMIDPETEPPLPPFEAVYPLTAGLTGGAMTRAMTGAVARIPALDEWQEPNWLSARDWENWRASLLRAHGPQSADEVSGMSPARMRLAYDELLANQLALALIRRSRKKQAGRPLKSANRKVAQLKAALPFDLTGSQRAALRDVFEDMGRAERMVRLIQGDVGSGKTVIALFAMAAAVEAGAQAAFMAPTEILARQHLEWLAPLCARADMTVDILTGRDKPKDRAEKLARLESGALDIIIGTHAIFQDTVNFHDLGLVVIDEQHRFGVRQRVALTDKGVRPDLLVMTATPIPRTLALTAYGDMDISAVPEKPPGRKPVDTRAVPLTRMRDVVAAVQRAADKGEQVYWVCPLVETSDLLDVTAVEERFETLKETFGDSVAVVHGRMAGPEKDAVMERFLDGSISVLLATTVIEVGVNAPNATVMVIEHAERFGLAQLHQLRGRVGRGDKPATCLLLYKPPLGETAKARIETLRQTEDGFIIAEEDLRLRGAGDVLGAAQSGFPQFRLADLSVHGELLAAARDDAKLIVETDPGLKTPRGAALRTLLYLFSRDDAVKLLSAG